MYTIDEIKELITALDKSTLTDLEIVSKTGEKMVLKKRTAKYITTETTEATPVIPAPSTAGAGNSAMENTDTAKNVRTINCPMVGVFYTASAPDAEPYVTVGAKVKKGDVVCIIEAMKLMNEVVATESGTITEILAENGDLVEYGQPLFVVE